MEPSDIIKEFKIFDGEYKRQAVDAALEHREEITPLLISVLENVVQDPEKYADHDSQNYAHIYAFMLLGHFKEEKAHDVLIDLFSLPGDLPYELFGDLVTENLSIVLLRTCGGRMDRIKELILNKEAYEYSRGSALCALSYAVIEGYVSREEVISFYGELFTGDEAPPTSNFHSELASNVCDLYPEELLETIQQAYEREMIDPFYIDYDSFLTEIEDGKEKVLERLRKEVESRQIDNIHKAMSWWACFDQSEKKDLFKNATIHEDLKQQTKRKATDKKSKKSKRKKAKASRKKNRKKKK